MEIANNVLVALAEWSKWMRRTLLCRLYNCFCASDWRYKAYRNKRILIGKTLIFFSLYNAWLLTKTWPPGERITRTTFGIDLNSSSERKHTKNYNIFNNLKLVCYVVFAFLRILTGYGHILCNLAQAGGYFGCFPKNNFPLFQQSLSNVCHTNM